MNYQNIVKYEPTAGDVHINAPLTNMSIAYLQSMEGFVASRVFPNIPVQKQSDSYFIFNRGDFNRDEMKKRAPGTESAGGGYNISNTTYYCDVWAFHKDIADQIRANYDSPLNADRNAMQYLTMKAAIKREKQWATDFFTDGVWDTDINKDWSNLTSSDPISDVRTGRTTVLKNTGFEPNTMVMGRNVYDTLADHPDIIERVNAGQTPGKPAMGTLRAMQELFEVENINVMNAINNTANEGATESSSFIGGDHCLLIYVPNSPGIEVPSAGYTFSWNGYTGAGPEGNVIYNFRMDHLKSDRFEIEMAWDQKLTGSDLGYMFDNVLTA